MAHLCKFVIGFIMIHVVAAGQSQEELCATVTKINCHLQYSAEPNEIVCASDGNTYSNRCLYAQAKCHNNDLGIKCKGKCSQCMISFKANTKANSVSTNEPEKLQNSYRKTTRRSRDGVTPRKNAYKLNGRKLQESTNSPLTVEYSTTMSVLDERLHFLTDNNITRTRKHLPGHHVAESTDGSQEVQGTIEKPLCKNGVCNSTQSISQSTKSTILSIIKTTTKNTIIGTIMTTLDMIVPTTTEKAKISKSTKDGKNKNDFTVSSSTTTPTNKNITSINLKTTQSTLINLLKTSSERSTWSPVTKIDSQVTPQATDMQFPTEIDFLLFCTDVDSKVCPKTLDPLCGTDNQFYLNLCTFNKSKCKDKTLMLRDDLSTCRQIKQ